MSVVNLSRVLHFTRRAAVFCVLPFNAGAEWNHSLGEIGALKAHIEAGVAAVTMPNTNLGVGRINPETGLSEGDVSWAEISFVPVLGIEFTNGWYGEVSVAGAATFGDGDSGAYTTGGDGEFDLETAFIGWRSDAPENDQSRPVLDLSVGRQTFDVGDGFLIDDGNFDFGDNGGVWLVPRQAFQRTLLARIDYRAVHSDMFFMEADPDNDEPAFAGLNLEYQFTTGHLGVLYFHILDTDNPTIFNARHGMDVLSARVNDVRLPFLPQVAWWGEVTQQTGEGRFGAFDASAWYAEGIYHFDQLPWKPRLSYRYAYFSGDNDFTDATRGDFDPLFYGFDKRGWGTWFQGEVIGGWLLFNNNQRNHLLHLAANPSEALTLGLIGGTFSLAESNYLGTPVTERHFGDEFNIYADWAISDQFFLSAAYALMFPGDGAIEAIGDDEKFHVIEFGLYMHF